MSEPRTPTFSGSSEKPAEEPLRGSNAPVFVVGCPRSGTTLLYHMLLSAGGFAVYRAESHIFTAIVPRFGDLSRRSARRAAIDAWTASHRFRLTGLEASAFAARIEAECRTGGDFLRIMMESVAEQQGVTRWADCTPEHILWASRISREIPSACFVHIIRDGRDVALSLMRQRWIRPLPGDTIPPLLVAGLYWEWIVEQGQRIGRSLGRQYDEVRFESVLREPTSALARLSRHIDHPLDYDRILDVGIGSVRRPNTSFAEQEAFNPTGRWKELPEPELRALESLIGGTLGRLGYELVTTRSVASRTLRAKRELYRRLFSTKRFLKQHTPMSRALTSLAILDTQTTR